MIIFGIRVLFQVLRTGTFYCPSCREDSACEHRQGRRWFHIFWIPLLMVGHVGEPFVRCSTCRTDFRLAVLDQPNPADVRKWLDRGTRALAVSLVSASADPLAAQSAAVHVLRASCAQGYSEQALERDRLALSALPAEDDFRRASQYLTDAGKEGVMREGLLVAHAAGRVTPQQSEILVRTAQALGLSQATVRGLNYEAAALLRPGRP